MKFKKGYFLILAGVILCCILTGCATYSFVGIKERLDRTKAQGYYIEGLEFVKQKKSWCGPAALASVLHFWGENINQDEIARDIYLPNVKGTLTFDLENYAVKKDYFAQTLHSDIHHLGRKVKADIPVIVMYQILPIFKWYHYLVIFGYDDTDRVMLAYTGKQKPQIISYSNFIRKWKGANNWMLVVCPPDKVTWELDAYYSNRLGLLYEKKGKLNLAKKSYENSLKIEPDNSTYAYNIGNIYLKEDNYRKAISFYEKAITLDSEFADAYNNLAYSLCELKEDLDKAEKYIKRAIKLNPDNKIYYLDTLGVIYLNQGKIEKAISTYEEALKLSGSFNKETLSVIYQHLTEALKRKGNFKEYKNYIDKMESLRGSN